MGGLCSSLPWFAFLTYVGTPPHIGAALQGLVHGLYRGLGIAMGYFIVSVFILKFGYLALFVGLGLIYLFMFGVYVCVLNVWPSPTIAERYSGEYTMLEDMHDDDDLYEMSARGMLEQQYNIYNDENNNNNNNNNNFSNN